MIIADLVSANLNTFILVGAVVAYTVKTLLEMTGKTKSAQIIRRENLDLTDRNRTLEADKVDRLAVELQLRARIESLELKVRELESRDQVAVLSAIKDHEVGAISRHSEHIGYLERITNALESPPDLLRGVELT